MGFAPFDYVLSLVGGIKRRLLLTNIAFFTPSRDVPSLIAKLVDSMKIQTFSTPTKVFTSSGYVLSLITEPVNGIKKATTFNQHLVF